MEEDVIEALDAEEIYHSDDGECGINNNPEKLCLGEILSGENIRRISSVITRMVNDTKQHNFKPK